MIFLTGWILFLIQIFKDNWLRRRHAPLDAIVTYLGLALTLVIGGCGLGSNERAVIDLPDQAYPAGIDHWPARKVVLFGDSGGTIRTLQENGTRVAKFMDVGVPDCARVIRLRVDAPRNRLWVMSASGICVYDLASLRLVRHLPMGDLSRYQLANALTDIALDTQGNAYAVDTGIDPTVYRIDSVTFAVVSWNKTSLPEGTGIYAPRHFPLNAITVTPDGKHLLYINAYTGTLHALDIVSRQQLAIAMQQPLYAVNALVAVADATSAGGLDLYALSASNNAITVISVDGDLKAARARAYAKKHLDNPLAAVWVRGALFVTNSQLLQHPEMHGDRDTPRPFSIARLNPDYFSKQAGNLLLHSVLGE